MAFLSILFSDPHQQVQSKVNLKYDSWHKEVLSKFGQMLGQNMQDFHSQISKVSFDLKISVGFEYLITNRRDISLCMSKYIERFHDF